MPGPLERFPRPRSNLNNPTFKKPSTTNQARVYDVVHTRIVTHPLIKKTLEFPNNPYYVYFYHIHLPLECSMY
jgi:hypothetical protein